MERDFLGLTIKQEILDETDTDPAEMARNSAMQWSFPNKAHPQYLSFKGQENNNNNNNNNNKPKIGFESLASAGLVTITTTTEVVDTIHQPYTTQIGAQYYSSSRGVVGTTELRGAPKTSPGPAQLTMFYAGFVCVYDNISPEKAQAIMLLAGNAPPVTPISTTSSTASPSLDHAFVGVNKCNGTSTSKFSSTIPITSRGTSQSAGVLFNNNTNETTMIRSIGVLKSPSNTTEFSAIPQARKASLARFLERRKERVVSASPYGNGKQSSQHMMTTPGSGNWNFSINSSGSSTSLPATN